VDGKYKYLNATDGVDCGNASFAGDPYFGKVKSCHYSNLRVFKFYSRTFESDDKYCQYCSVDGLSRFNVITDSPDEELGGTDDCVIDSIQLERLVFSDGAVLETGTQQSGPFSVQVGDLSHEDWMDGQIGIGAGVSGSQLVGTRDLSVSQKAAWWYRTRPEDIDDGTNASRYIAFRVVYNVRGTECSVPPPWHP
jgi:hypothetical protein